MKKTIILVMLMTLAVGGTAFAKFGGMRAPRADGHYGMHQDRMGSVMFLRHADAIGLTEQQEDEFAGMMEQFHLLMIDKNAELEKLRVKMHSLKRGDASEGETFAMMDKVSALQLEIRKMKYKHRTAIEDKLTDEQKAKLEELRDNMRSRGDGDGPRGFGRGDRDGDGDGRGRKGGRGPGTGLGFGR